MRPVNPQFYYAFAFDDDGDSSDGPGAIISRAFSPNDIVGGSFTVLVIYHAGQFTAYRRTGRDATETLNRATRAFIADPSGRLPFVQGSTISFALNFDATLDDGTTRLFQGVGGALPDLLQFNFVTTDEQRRDPNNELSKTFDALGNRLSSVFATINIRTTQTFNNTGNGATNAGVNEPTGDVFPGAGSNNLTPETLDALDISNFTIGVQRNNQ